MPMQYVEYTPGCTAPFALLEAPCDFRRTPEHLQELARRIALHRQGKLQRQGTLRKWGRALTSWVLVPPVLPEDGGAGEWWRAFAAEGYGRYMAQPGADRDDLYKLVTGLPTPAQGSTCDDYASVWVVCRVTEVEKHALPSVQIRESAA